MRFKLLHHPWRACVLGILFCTLAAAGCGSPTEGGAVPDPGSLSESQAPVVYGTDNRTDVYAHGNATLRARAQQSTVALMQPAWLNTTNPNNVTFYRPTLGAAKNLCSTERFRDDPAAAYCSGTLIDDDLVLTAGHCFDESKNLTCANTRFVFNFYRTSATTLQTVTTQDIFSCQSVVASFDSGKQGLVNGKYQDYAIVRLDRAATPRFTPAPIRPWSSALQNRPVAVIGSGSGIPFKIDSGGAVMYGQPSYLDVFYANTDTFGGNSGSAVYENTGYTVAGLLSAGAPDYVLNGSCYVVNVCPETGCASANPEMFTYVRPAISAYCQKASSTRLCNTNYSTSVFSGPRSRYSITRNNFTLSVTDTGGADGTRTFTNIVRLKFTDSVTAFDVDGNAGKVFRLYQASFGRTPDPGGLGFWINAMDSGTSLLTIAGHFMSSKEFADLYGANPSNETFVTNLYNNVLHRAPETAGYNYWVNALYSGYPRANALVDFSEGYENRAGVLPAMADGIVYTQ